MLFESDPILRQIKQLTQFISAMAGASGAVPEEEEEADRSLADAYLGLLGLDVGFADSLGADGLLRMLYDDGQRRALVELLLAHGDLLERRGDAPGARRRWARAAQVVQHVDDEDLAREVSARAP